MNKLTKLSRAIVAIAMMLAVSLPSLAHDFEVDGIYYNILEEEEVVEVAQLADDIKSHYEIVIPDDITFDGITYYITKIGDNAFANCTSTYIQLPSTLEIIGNYAFSNCSLSSIQLPSTLKTIGEFAFYDCDNLKAITIPENVETINESAFKYCTNLEIVNFNAKNCNKMGSSNAEVFCLCPITTLNIGDSVTRIPSYAFRNCSRLTEVTIPNSVTTIDQEAFWNCKNLNNVVIPETVKFIGNNAFAQCSNLNSITIPNSIKSIGSYAFYLCENLSGKLEVNASIIREYAFQACKNLTEVTIGNISNNEIKINNSAFSLCSSLKKVTIGKNVTELGAEIFRSCPQLNTIVYEADSCIATKADITYNLKDYTLIIGNCVKYLPNNCFNNGVPSRIISLNTQPPTGDNAAFSNTSKYNSTLYIPKGSYAAYWSAPVWQDFKNIKEIEQVATAISSPENMGLTLNNSVKLEAILMPTNTTITTLYWETSNPEVATVDQEGNVTAVANGKATITAMTIDGSELSASCEVKIGMQDVESISISQKSAELKPNEMLNLNCTVIPENATNKAITWTSDNTSIAVVRTNSDGSATVLAVAPGIANITATTNDGTNLSDTCVVKVLKLAESITLNKTTSAINTGEIIDLNATVLPDDADYKNVTWATSDEALATVKDNGNGTATISAINPGVVTITATTADGSNLSASCEITITKLAESITLDKTTAEMLVNEEETLTATILPDNTSYKVVTWTSSDESLATVKDNGDGTATITAINPGVVIITATTADGSNLSASCEITITKLAESITLDKTTAEMLVDEEETLTATVLPENSSNKAVTWASSDETLATVQDNGDGTATITAVNPGVVTITATTADGSNLSASCEITITKLAESITLDKTTATAFEGEIIEITATILPDNTSDKTVAWTISDESVATLKDNGDGSATISVIKVGITTVTASTTDGSNLSATCEISGLSGISNISIDGNNDEKRYDVHGRLLSKPTPGINIIKMSDGSTRKEWVK